MPSIKIRSDDFNVDMCFNSRFNIIRGDSGTCKTYFIELLLLRRTDVTVTSDLKYSVMNATNYEALLRASEHSLLFLDDVLDVNSVANFEYLAQKYAVVNNLYIVIIERTTTNFYNISYDIRSIYDMVAVDITHYKLVPSYEYFNLEEVLQ